MACCLVLVHVLLMLFVVVCLPCFPPLDLLFFLTVGVVVYLIMLVITLEKMLSNIKLPLGHSPIIIAF